MSAKQCLWCRKPFEILRKRVALCPSCRTLKNRLDTRERDRQHSADRSVLLASVLPTLPPDLHPLARKLADDYLARTETPPVRAAHDMQPAGTKTAAGPDEGRTSEYADLRSLLDELSAVAASDAWWSANPPEDTFFRLGSLDRMSQAAA